MKILVNWVLLDVLGFNADKIRGNSISLGVFINYFMVVISFCVFIMLIILTVLEIRNIRQKKLDKYGRQITSKRNLTVAFIADTIFLIVAAVHLILLVQGY